MTSLDRTISEIFAWTQQARHADKLRGALAEAGCFIYGAGQYGRMVAKALHTQGYTVRGFIDRRPSAALVDGINCFTPDAVDNTLASTSILVMGVNNYTVPLNDVAAWAENLFRDTIFVAELPDVVSPDLGNFWQGPRQLIFDNRDALLRLSTMLGDEHSQEVLEQIVRYHLTGRPSDHPAIDSGPQYFPDDLPMACSNIHIVDCGAFPGDMLEASSKAGLTLESWYAFEPDPDNFKHLSNAMKKSEVPAAVLFPCGVGDKTSMISFAVGGGTSSRVATDGEESLQLQLIKLDDVIRARRIDLIKLDIEGAESAAIDGMRGLITQHRPRLAVAAYHKPDDLWELAFQIELICPGGRYALRQHAHNGYDTVLYVDWSL